MSENFWFAGTAIVLFLVIAACDRRYPVLRDMPAEGSVGVTRSFSLGRVQMAFWTILIIAALVKLAALNGWTTAAFRFDGTLLVLMGISGVTGLASMAVDVQKDKNAADAAAAQTAAVDAVGGLEAQVAGSAMSAEEMAAVQSEIAAKRMAAKQAADMQKRLERKPEPHNFFRDILEDDNGNSLHRLQMVLFTLLAGVMFTIGTWKLVGPAVGADIVLPTIPENFLELMGISSGLYVGFKVPGKATQ